jgi:hypothetical protein
MLVAKTAQRGGFNGADAGTTSEVSVEFGGAYAGAGGPYTGARWTTPIEVFLNVATTRGDITTKVRTRKPVKVSPTQIACVCD